MRAHKSNIVYAVAFAALAFAVGLILFELIFAQAGAGTALDNGVLSDAQKQAIDTTLDTGKVFTQWAIAVIGATAFFLKMDFDKGARIAATDLGFASAIFLLCITSIAFWQMAVSLTAELLAVQQFPLQNDRLHRLFAYQYVTGLAAICVFATYVFQFFWIRIKK